jgi:hypothetical protein
MSEEAEEEEAHFVSQRRFTDVIIPSKAKILKLEAILLKKEFVLPAESSEQQQQQQQQLMIRESSTRSNSTSSFSIGFVSLLPLHLQKD